MNSTGVDVYGQPSGRPIDRQPSQQQQHNSTYKKSNESVTVDEPGEVTDDTSLQKGGGKNSSDNDADVTYASATTSSKSYARSESPDRFSSDSGNESQDLIQSDGTPEGDKATEEDANQEDDQTSERNPFSDETTIDETDHQPLNSPSGNSTLQADTQNRDAADQLSRRAFFNDKLANIRGAPILSEIIKLRNQHTSKLFNGSKIRRQRRRKRKKKFRTLNNLLSDQLSSNQKLDPKNINAINNQLKKAMQTRQSSTANGYSSINSHTGMAEAALLNQFSPTPIHQQPLADHHLAAPSQTIPNVIKQQFPAMPLTTAMQKLLLGRLALANNLPSQQQQNLRPLQSKLLPVSGGSNRLAAAMLYNSNEQQQQLAREFFKQQSLGLNRDLKGHSLLPYDSLASNSLLKYAQAANQMMPNDEHSSGEHKALIPVEIIGLDPTISDSILQHQQAGAGAAIDPPAAIVDSQPDSTRVFESIGVSNGQDTRFKTGAGDSDIVSAVQHSKPFQTKPASIFHIHHYHHTKTPDNSPLMRKPQGSDGNDEPQSDHQSTAIVQASDGSAAQTTNGDDSQSQEDGPKPPQQVLVNDKGQLVYVSMNDVDGSTTEASNTEQDSSDDGKQPAGPGAKQQRPAPSDANEPDDGSSGGSDVQSDPYHRPSSGTNSDHEPGAEDMQLNKPRGYGRDHMPLQANSNQIHNHPIRRLIGRHNSSRLMSYPEHHDRFSNSYWHLQADATGTQEQNAPDRPASNKYPLLMVSYKPQQPQHYSNYTLPDTPQQGLTRKYPYNEGSESKSSLVAATKQLIGTKHLHEASQKLLSQLGSKQQQQQQSNLSQMINHDNNDEGQYLSKSQTPKASGSLLIGPLSNHMDRLNKSNFNLALSNNSELDSYNIANSNRVPLLPLPFRSQTIPFVSHFPTHSNKTYNPIAAGGFGRHYNLFNASVLAQTNQNIPENSVLLKHIASHNTSSDSIGSNATKLTNEELLNLLNHLKHLNGTDSNMKFIRRPNNKLELVPAHMNQAPGNRFYNSKPSEVTGLNQARGKSTPQSNTNDTYGPSNGIDMNGNIDGGDIRQLIDNSASTSLTDANGLSNLALAFIFTVTLLTFVVIAASLIYRKRRVVRSSRTIEPTTDACSGPYSLNRGRLNLAQRTKHFMRSNFVATSNNSHPTSLKSLNLYDTNDNNNSDPNDDAKINGANRSNGNPNCKFAAGPSGGNNSNGKLFNSTGTTSRWATKNNKTSKVLSTFGSQSEDHNSVAGCNHNIDHGNGPPIRTLNTRSHQTKQSYLKSLISSKNNHLHRPIDALDAINKASNQVSAKFAKSSLVLADDDDNRSPAKLLSNDDGNSSLKLSRLHHRYDNQHQQHSDKVSYLNIKQHGSNDNCRPPFKTTAEPNNLQDVSHDSKQHERPAPTLTGSESDDSKQRIKSKTDLIINSNEEDDYDDDGLIDQCQEVTVERISSPSLTSSFMLQTNSPGMGHEQKEAREFGRAKYNRPNRLSTIRSIGFDSFNMKKNAKDYKSSSSLHDVVKNLKSSITRPESRPDAAYRRKDAIRAEKEPSDDKATATRDNHHKK